MKKKATEVRKLKDSASEPKKWCSKNKGMVSAIAERSSTVRVVKCLLDLSIKRRTLATLWESGV